MKSRTQLILSSVLLGAGILAMASVLYMHRVDVKEWWEARTEKDVPVALNRNQAVQSNANANTNVSTLPSEVNLKVPFTSQAPHAKWDEEHGEFCEEASAMMLGRYWQDRGIASADDAESALQLLKRWQVDTLGYFMDTTAAETARILSDFYELEGVAVIDDPSVEEIKAELAAGRPVIIPAAGQELGNPNFTPPGPIYHMFLIKGYTADGKFITNDPGTRKGADYLYDIPVVMNAMHDWVPSSDRKVARNGTPTGGKKMIVVRGK